MHQIEKEFKNLLTQDEYKRLYEHYKNAFKPAQQHTNIYFDDRTILQQARCALRIRLIEGTTVGELTLKVPHSENELSEYTQLYPVETLRDWIEAKAFPVPTDLQAVFQMLGIEINTVYMTTSLTTMRYEAPIDLNVLLVLDKSTYHNTTDYELEMEVHDIKSGALFFADFLTKHGIEKRPTKNKIARALAEAKLRHN